MARRQSRLAEERRRRRQEEAARRAALEARASATPPAAIPRRGRQLPIPETAPPPVPSVRLPAEQPRIPRFLQEFGQQRPADISTFLRRYEELARRPRDITGVTDPITSLIDGGGYFPQYDPAQGFTPQRPGGGLGPILFEAFGGAVPEGERLIPLATEAGDVTMNILRTYGRNAAINTEVGRSLLPGSIRESVAQLLPWYAWGYDSYQEMLRDMNYTEIPGTGAWIKNDPFEPATTAGGAGGVGGGGAGTVTYRTVGGGSARRYNPTLIQWRI